MIATALVSTLNAAPLGIAGSSRTSSIGQAEAILRAPYCSDEENALALSYLGANERTEKLGKILGDVCKDERIRPIQRRRCLLMLVAIRAKEVRTISDFKDIFVQSGVLGSKLSFPHDPGILVSNLPELLDGDWMADTIIAVEPRLPVADDTRIYLRLLGSMPISAVEAALENSSTRSDMDRVKVDRIVISPRDVVDELLLRAVIQGKG